MNILELKGAKVLFHTQRSAALKAGAVEEFSPSKRYVRVGDEWASVDHVNVVEVLTPKPASVARAEAAEAKVEAAAEAKAEAKAHAAETTLASGKR